MPKFRETLTVFLIGCVLYSVLEILFRGYTHWSMSLTGGICFSVLYHLHTHCRDVSLFRRALLGSLCITAVELAIGCTVNLLLGWDVWDYSDQPLNLLGQICPLFSLCWLILSVIANPVCRHLQKEIKNGIQTCNIGKSHI